MTDVTWQERDPQVVSRVMAAFFLNAPSQALELLPRGLISYAMRIYEY